MGAHAPASAADLTVGAELLADHTALTVFGDKGDSSAERARRNQAHPPPPVVREPFNAVRRIIETVTGPFPILVKHTPTLCFSLNPLPANAAVLQIQAHAFPISLLALLPTAQKSKGVSNTERMVPGTRMALNTPDRFSRLVPENLSGKLQMAGRHPVIGTFIRLPETTTT
jgi:hypothetical protein